MMSSDADFKYARSGDVHIAYVTLGAGQVDLILTPPGIATLEPEFTSWEMYERFARFARAVVYSPRGGGMSDPVPLDQVPTMDDRIDDLRAVADDAGIERAVIVGQGHGGPAAMLFAATYPDRVSSLLLFNTYARWQRADDYPLGMPAESTRLLNEGALRTWGTGASLAYFRPHLAADPDARRQWARLERHGGSPAQLERMMTMWTETDVRDILPTIRVPTLVVHRTGDTQFRVGHGHYLAEHIPGAKFLEFPGDDHFFVGEDLDLVGDEIEEFVTGRRSVVAADRVLATVMFTDIVDSTATASAMGDRAWRQLLDRHDETVGRQLERYRGTAVKHTGDGIAATFDGPARAITCACAIRDAVRGLGLDIRAGLHTGEIERRGADVSGVGVHIAARVANQAGPGEVLVSSTVKDLVVGSGIAFEDRGTHALKGVPDEWRLLRVLA
jgi:class 3 adenylate cyclase